MGKNWLSYFLLICAAVVAYLYITNYIDTIMEENFTTSAVKEVNQKTKDIWIGSEGYQLWVNWIE